MKTLLLSVLVASASMTGAVSAGVAPGAAAALAHFNQDHDGQDDVRVPGTGDEMTVSSRSGRLADVYQRFNADHDSQDDIRGQAVTTLISGTPAHGAEIFARIEVESAGDE